MEFIGYVTKDNLAQALTYGPQADMAAWVDVNRVVDATTSLYAAKAGDDVPRAVVDQPYFQSLVDNAV